MRELVAVCMPGGPRFVDVLRRVWDDGDAVLPVDPALPAPAVAQLLDALAPAWVVDEHGQRASRPGATPLEAGDALVIATSGSTGAPKGVIHTHASVEASARATNGRLDLDPDRDHWLCSLPVAHVAGLSVVTRALTARLALTVLPRFDADAVTDAARRGATLTTLVPTALGRIDASIFRRIVVGGTSLPPELPPNCVASYGMTETGSAVAYDGVALDGADIAVRDGEIVVRGPMLLRAYRDLGDPAGTDPKDPDGWFRTDDAGEWDADGRLVVHGRRGDVIVSGGEKVWPAAVEAVLERLPAVAEVAVVGRADPVWGRAVTAVVVPADPAHPPTLDVLRDAVKAQLHPAAAPRALELVTALPRTPIGKVRRRDV